MVQFAIYTQLLSICVKVTHERSPAFTDISLVNSRGFTTEPSQPGYQTAPTERRQPQTRLKGVRSVTGKH